MSDFYSHGSVDAFRQSHFGLGQIGNGFGGPANPLQPMQPMARSVVPPKTISGPSMPAGLAALTSPPRQVEVPVEQAVAPVADAAATASPAQVQAQAPTTRPNPFKGDGWKMPLLSFFWDMQTNPEASDKLMGRIGEHFKPVTNALMGK